MSLTKFNGETNNIQSLPDKPTLLASELKGKFDKTGDELKAYINETLTTEIDAELGTKANSSNVYSKSDVYNKTETDTNLATKAPTSHSSSNTTYGLGTQSNYGHTKLANNLTTSSYQDGVALSAYQGKLLNDKANTAQNTANTAKSEAESAYNKAVDADSNANERLSRRGGTLEGSLVINGDCYVDGNTVCEQQITNRGPLYNNNGSIKSDDIRNNNTVSNNPNLYITESGWFRRTTNTSSQRYKKDIKDLKDEELNSEKLYDLKVKQFKYKKEYQPNEKDSRYNKNLVGFIAEDVAEIYPIAADFNEEGQVENWNERYLIPAMLDLIQKQNERIKVLEQKL